MCGTFIRYLRVWSNRISSIGSQRIIHSLLVDSALESKGMSSNDITAIELVVTFAKKSKPSQEK